MLLLANLAAAAVAGDGFDLIGRWQEATSLLTNLAGFTRLVESFDPVVVAANLNESGPEGRDRLQHEEMVAKISGDAMHVLSGAPATSSTMPPAPWPAGSRSAMLRRR